MSDIGTDHQPKPPTDQDMQNWPRVGLACCVKRIANVPFHSVAIQYVPGVCDTAHCLPMLLPAVHDRRLISAMLDNVSGLVLPGSISNVDPERYGQARSTRAEPFDFVRDNMVFPLLEQALERGIPVFAICRGLQELNAFLGGTLDPCVHERENRLDHRAIDHEERDRMFETRHKMTFIKNGVAARLGFQVSQMVNTLHRQAIDKLADGLKVEGVAEDGTIEMVSMPGAKGYLLAVQWHPEYLHAANPLSKAMFALFGHAVHHHHRTGCALTLDQALNEFENRQNGESKAT